MVNYARRTPSCEGPRPIILGCPGRLLRLRQCGSACNCYHEPSDLRNYQQSRRRHQIGRHLAKVPAQLFWAVLAASCVCASAAAPAIVITNLPIYGTTSNLAGVIVNASPAARSAAVFIYVPGYGWVTKPTCAQPLTLIQPDGSWSADVTTGGSDALATRIAALLVSTNYSQPCVQGAAALPTNVFRS